MLGTARKLLGYVLLLLSSVAYVLVFVVPFLTSLTTAEKAQWAVSIYVFSQITWWSGIALLGKECLQWLKLFRERCLQWLKREKADVDRCDS